MTSCEHPMFKTEDPELGPECDRCGRFYIDIIRDMQDQATKRSEEIAAAMHVVDVARECADWIEHDKRAAHRDLEVALVEAVRAYDGKAMCTELLEENRALKATREIRECNVPIVDEIRRTDPNAPMDLIEKLSEKFKFGQSSGPDDLCRCVELEAQLAETRAKLDEALCKLSDSDARRKHQYDLDRLSDSDVIYSLGVRLEEAESERDALQQQLDVAKRIEKERWEKAVAALYGGVKP